MFNKFKVKSLFKKADSFFKDEEYDDALDYYDNILELDDSNLKALYKKAFILYKRKLFDESIQVLKSILDLKCCIDAILLLGRIYLLKDDTEKGMYYYKLSLNENVFNHYKFIEEILFFGHYKFRYICKDYKRFYNITVSLCDLYLEKEDSYEIKFFKSDKLYNLGRYEYALDIIEKFPESYLDNSQYNYLKSSILLDLSRYEDALSYSNKILENSEDILQIQKKGECLYYLGDFNEAIKYFNKVKEFQELENPYIFLSKISIKNEDYEDALKNINKAINLLLDCLNKIKSKYSTLFFDKDACEVFYYKSLILFKLGRYDEALKICNCILDKVPDCSEAIKLKNQIESNY